MSADASRRGQVDDRSAIELDGHVVHELAAGGLGQRGERCLWPELTQSFGSGTIDVTATRSA